MHAVKLYFTFSFQKLVFLFCIRVAFHFFLCLVQRIIPDMKFWSNSLRLEATE